MSMLFLHLIMHLEPVVVINRTSRAGKSVKYIYLLAQLGFYRPYIKLFITHPHRFADDVLAGISGLVEIQAHILPTSAGMPEVLGVCPL